MQAHSQIFRFFLFAKKYIFPLDIEKSNSPKWTKPQKREESGNFTAISSERSLEEKQKLPGRVDSSGEIKHVSSHGKMESGGRLFHHSAAPAVFGADSFSLSSAAFNAASGILNNIALIVI